MSTAASVRGAARRPGIGREATHQLPKPTLHLVPRPALQAPRLPFVLVVVGVLAAGLLGLLMLNTMAAQDAFRLHDLLRQSSALADQEQSLRVGVEQDAAPGMLAARAHRLGMVATTSPTFLRLKDGRILGAATAAPAPPPPVVAKPVTKTTVKATAKPAVKPGARPAATKPGTARPAATKPATTKPATAPAPKPTGPTTHR